VSKSPAYLVLGDESWPVESLLKALAEETHVDAFVEGRGWLGARRDAKKIPPKATTGASQISRALESFECDARGADETVAIVGFRDSDTSASVVATLKSRFADMRILQLGARVAGPRQSLRRDVRWTELLGEGVDEELELLALQKRARELQKSVEGAERIAILLQDDPDPDGLASALAFRKILGRKPQTAPLVSFGSITRPENVAMARLLEIEVEHIHSPADLEAFDRVVLVDCQPSFFKGKTLPVDVILDHHPKASVPMLRKPDFVEIREDLGATSTLMTLYLRALGIEISQRLATALLYGIKTDTLLLNREVSEQDLAAFVHLYPRSNGNILRRIERPELPLAYLEVFRKALGRLKVRDGLALMVLGKVEREEWIPQTADFGLQVEGAELAVAVGIYDDKVVLSGRAFGPNIHCGELFKSLFNGGLGCAGGHRSMAKAIVGKERWETKFGARSLRSMPLLQASVFRILGQGLKAQGLKTTALGSVKASKA